jgi:hypothetical protein
MTTYLLGSGSVDRALATATITDYLGPEYDAVAITAGPESWLAPICKELGIPQIDTTPVLDSTDTVIAPSDADALEDILKTGAVVLDVSDGLIPLELVEEIAGEIPEVPDVPDELPALPEEPVAAAPRTKPVVEPLPPVAEKKETARKKAAPKPKLIPSLPGTESIKMEFRNSKDEVVAKLDADELHGAGFQYPPRTSFIDTTPTEEGALRSLINVHVRSASVDVMYQVLDLLRGK